MTHRVDSQIADGQGVHAETPKDRSVSVRQKNGGFYDGRYRNPLILSHFRNRPTGFQAF